MTDKQKNPDPIAHAARLLREAAEELRQAHTYPRSEDWGRETDAKAAYDEHMAAAQALEDWEAAVGAGGVQALSAAPAIGDELRDTLVAVSAAIAERDDRAAQKMISEILAASTTRPAEQQAQPGAVYAELPQPDSWFHFTAQFWENKLCDFADRTHALRMQPTPKAARTPHLLAADHKGMRVDYSGLLSQCRRALQSREPANAEMLRQFQGHLQELGRRWYAGDTVAVDEFLQLYCIEHEARVALAAQGGQ